MSDLITEAITAHYGERCTDFDPDCWCCKAWAEYDRMAADRAKVLREAVRAVDEWIDIFEPLWLKYRRAVMGQNQEKWTTGFAALLTVRDAILALIDTKPPEAAQ